MFDRRGTGLSDRVTEGTTLDDLMDDITPAIGAGARAIGVDVRVGLHTGEIELAGDDIRGIAVHVGSRVAGLAGAGEVPASGTVKDLVAGSGIDFEDRGTHELKGVPGEWRPFAVRA